MTFFLDPKCLTLTARQKQDLIKKINLLGGKTSWRFDPGNIDFVVVDRETMAAEACAAFVSQNLTTQVANGDFLGESLKKFINEQTLKILKTIEEKAVNPNR